MNLGTSQTSPWYSRLSSPLRRVWQAWWDSRLPRKDIWSLTQNNIYILPTKAGLAFGLTLATLLIASINYQLNLGYVLTFLLAGSAVVSMHITHSNMRGLSLHLKPVNPVFAQDNAAFEVVIVNSKQERYGLGLKIQSASEQTMVWVDIPAQGQTTANLSWLAPHRGRHTIPTLTVETRFPLGLFRAWTLWRPAAQLLVYPQPENPAPALPAVRAEGQAAGGTSHGAGSDFDGVRGYRRGDSLKFVIWKKAAQAQASGGDLVMRETTGVAVVQLWLDWQQTHGLSTEERLSRLTSWILTADAPSQTGPSVRFGLSLPGVNISPDCGESHRHACLEALALWTA